MKTAILILAALAAIFLGLGIFAESSARSQDEKLGALVPYSLAALFGGIDGLLIFGYAMWRLFS